MRTRRFSHRQHPQTVETRSQRVMEIGEGRDQVGDLVRTELLSNRQARSVLETRNAPGSNLPLWAIVYAFDVLGMGWIVCDTSSHILGLNQTAKKIVENRDGLELGCNGMLRTTCEENVSLLQAVKQAAEATRLRNSGEQDVVMAVSRQPAKAPLILCVHRVRGTSQDGSVGPMVLVLTLDSSVCSSTTAEDLYQLYRFTLMESRLALLLMEGKTLENCCCELGIHLSTGKTHLKHLFKKARVRRQSELVILLFKSIGFARLGPESSESNTPVHGVTVH